MEKKMIYKVMLMGFLLLSVGCVEPSYKNGRIREVSEIFILESVEHRKDIGTIITTKLGVQKLLFPYFLKGDIPVKGTKVILIRQQVDSFMEVHYYFYLKVIND